MDDSLNYSQHRSELMAASPRSPVTAALDDDLFDDSVVEDTIDGSAAVRWDPKFPMCVSSTDDKVAHQLTRAIAGQKNQDRQTFSGPN